MSTPDPKALSEAQVAHLRDLVHPLELPTDLRRAVEGIKADAYNAGLAAARGDLEASLARFIAGEEGAGNSERGAALRTLYDWNRGAHYVIGGAR